MTRVFFARAVDAGAYDLPTGALGDHRVGGRGGVGLSKAAIAKVLDQEIAKLEANWTRDLVNHMSAYKSG